MKVMLILVFAITTLLQQQEQSELLLLCLPMMLCFLSGGGGSPVITLGGGRDIGSMIGQITAVDKYGNPSVYDLRHEPHNLKIELDFSSSSFSRNQVDNDVRGACMLVTT